MLKNGPNNVPTQIKTWTTYQKHVKHISSNIQNNLQKNICKTTQKQHEKHIKNIPKHMPTITCTNKAKPFQNILKTSKNMTENVPQTKVKNNQKMQPNIAKKHTKNTKSIFKNI